MTSPTLVWEITQDGAVMPSISDQQVAPAQLLDIVSCGCSAEKACNQMNCSCRVAGLSCTDYCTCAGGDHCCNPMTTRHDNDYEDDDDNEDCEDEKDHWNMYQASHYLSAQVVI